MRLALPLAVAVLSLSLVGCPDPQIVDCRDEPGDPLCADFDAGTPRDAGPDPRDVGPMEDAHDGRLDAGPRDAGADAGSDAGSDAGDVDAGPQPSLSFDFDVDVLPGDSNAAPRLARSGAHYFAASAQAGQVFVSVIPFGPPLPPSLQTVEAGTYTGTAPHPFLGIATFANGDAAVAWTTPGDIHLTEIPATSATEPAAFADVPHTPTVGFGSQGIGLIGMGDDVVLGAVRPGSPRIPEAWSIGDDGVLGAGGQAGGSILRMLTLERHSAGFAWLGIVGSDVAVTTFVMPGGGVTGFGRLGAGGDGDLAFGRVGAEPGGYVVGNTAGNLWAQAISEEAASLGPQIPLFEGREPSLTWISQREAYLLVWVSPPASNPQELRAALFDSSFQQLSAIAATNGGPTGPGYADPDVVSAPSGDVHGMVFRARLGPATSLYQRLNTLWP